MLKQEDAKKNQIPPLLTPPLVEAIFEIRWELQGDQQTGRYRDPSYPMMYGRLYERFKKEFPLIEDLPSNQVHPEASPYVVRHRMRKDKVGYPLVQIGPGILTVNETKSYSWSTFKSTILRLVESILDLYPMGTLPLRFIKCDLRYLNAVFIDLQKENPLAFLAEKLHMKVEMPPEIYTNSQVQKDPHTIHLTLAHALEEPLGNLALSVGLGQMEGKNAFLVQTMIDSLGEAVPEDAGEFDSWLESAHNVAENAFLSIYQGPLLHRFCGAV